MLDIVLGMGSPMDMNTVLWTVPRNRSTHALFAGVWHMIPVKLPAVALSSASTALTSGDQGAKIHVLTVEEILDISKTAGLTER